MRKDTYWLTAVGCLVLTGCTETVVREIPVNYAASSDMQTVASTGYNPLTTVPAATNNMVSADTAMGQLEDPVTVEPFGSIPATAIASPTLQLQNPDSPMTLGTPGMSVNCQQTLPCRWISADTQFSLTITRADNIATRNRLQLSYTLVTAHDTEVSVSAAGNALDAAGLPYQPSEQTLGNGVSSTAQSLLAGDALLGELVFDEGTASNTLSQWTISVLDAGLVRSASFTNIPVGTVTSAFADCEYTLPCVWVSPQRDVTISLLSAGGFTSNNRLGINFVIQPAASMQVAIDAGASARSSEGALFTGRTHTLGTQIGYDKLTDEANAVVSLPGSVNFYRSETIPTVLQELQLILYRDSPVPRWNPRFVNVPVQ